MTEPPFIPAQRLSELVCVPGEELAFLNDEHFHPFDQQERESAGRPPNAPSAPDGWRLVTDREIFLTDPHYPRLVLTIDGGIGKTTALEQIAYLRSVKDTGHLCLSVEAAELPASSARLLGPSAPTPAEDRDRPPILIEKFRQIPATASLDGASVWRLIQRKIREQKFTLLVDALDQLDLEDGPKPKRLVRALALFLKQHPGVRCVVSGRPYAVSRYWRLLSKDTGSWKLAAVGPFTKDQQRDYLGKAFFDSILQLEAQVMTVPRALKRLRDMSSAQLARLRTAADVYWESLQPILHYGCHDQRVTINEEDALELLALLAFEMIRQGKSVRVKRGRQFRNFCTRSYRRRASWLKRRGIHNLAAFMTRLGELDKLNIIIEHAVSDTRGLTEIRWQDRTLQDMFAAIWITRFAPCANINLRTNAAEPTDDVGSRLRDRDWLAGKLFVPADESTHKLADMWRLACGMPDNDRVCDPLIYVRMLSVLYGPHGDKTVRSTEMVWRSWPRLLNLACWLDDVRAPERLVAEATADVQRAVYERVKRGELRYDPDQPLPRGVRQAARHVVEQFLAEFPAIRFGQHRLGHQPRARRIAVEFDEEWFPTEIPAGIFLMGTEGSAGDERPHDGMIEAPFWLAKYPVTNELYSLFDRNHSERFTNDKTYSRKPRCPTIYINWFDAWCAVTWLHGCLPDEYEWERACRGTKGTSERFQFWYGDDEEELGKYAWYRENSRDRTHAIDERKWYGRLAKWPNDLGLFHLHGNVWEWTASWYGHDPTYSGASRVLRGGSWRSGTRNCRCAFRYRDAPEDGRYLYGFRVCRRACRS